MAPPTRRIPARCCGRGPEMLPRPEAGPPGGDPGLEGEHAAECKRTLSHSITQETAVRSRELRGVLASTARSTPGRLTAGRPDYHAIPRNLVPGDPRVRGCLQTPLPPACLHPLLRLTPQPTATPTCGGHHTHSPTPREPLVCTGGTLSNTSAENHPASPLNPRGGLKQRRGLPSGALVDQIACQERGSHSG